MLGRKEVKVDDDDDDDDDDLFVSQGLCFARVESKHEIRVILYSDYIYI